MKVWNACLNKNIKREKKIQKTIYQQTERQKFLSLDARGFF